MSEAEEMRTSRTMLEHHLRYNNYPPLPLAWRRPLEDAITAVQQNEPERTIRLPRSMSVSVRGGKPRHSLKACEVLEATNWTEVGPDDMSYGR